MLQTMWPHASIKSATQILSPAATLLTTLLRKQSCHFILLQVQYATECVKYNAM